ncbi:16S rRNA (cytidine(1402)-2'-O)-methyltransferase [Candidatus Peregrinibacteria bacterium]|nr:16S rRNA (cytidine(1402)-2'-O)-methyltransferase [Candidatus Peregrinibacteria bacterium]
MLYVVATPIGNLEDITLRALRILKEVDCIVAEDTRHSGIFLKKYGIDKPLLSFHAHSNHPKVEKIIDILKNGKNVALISDAGTPGISDPGFVLIRAALDVGIPISPIPGPSAFLAALSVSGLPTDKFLYLGFLPRKKGRHTLLLELQNEKRTIVFYESPHRILRTLEELESMLGDRCVAIAREITKLYEEIFRGSLSEAKQHFSQKNIKGEFVIVLGGKNQNLIDRCYIYDILSN